LRGERPPGELFPDDAGALDRGTAAGAGVGEDATLGGAE